MKLDNPTETACRLRNEHGWEIADSILGYPAWMVTSAEELEQLKHGLATSPPF